MRAVAQQGKEEGLDGAGKCDGLVEGSPCVLYREGNVCDPKDCM